MNSKLFGSILMILGTSIGAGMIALPVVTAPETLTLTIITLIGCWAISTVGAYALAEVALHLPPGSNIISMSKACFGNLGQIISWVMYLLLMYSLTCAYLSGTSDMVNSLFTTLHLFNSPLTATLIVLLLFTHIIHHGIKLVDPLNRLLMFVKACLYVFLLVSVFSHSNADNLLLTGETFSLHWPSGIITVILTSFGYSVIIPSICDYLDQDKKQIRIAILIGSILPLFIYILWIVVIQSLIPHGGEFGLLAILKASNTNEALYASMSHLTENQWVARAAKLFMPVTLITSFLGVSLSLRDFLADGLNMAKNGLQGWLLIVLTFLPPFLIVLVAPGVFIKALSHAGIICFLLLILLPIAMLMYVKTTAQGKLLKVN